MRDIETRLKKMSAADIVDYSIEVYKRNAKKLTVLTLIMYVPFALLYVFLSGYISNDLNRLTSGGEPSFSLVIAFMLVSIGLFFVYACYFLTINGVLQAAITKVVYNDVVNGKCVALKEVVRDSFKKIFKILGYRLLFYLIMSGAIMGIVFVFYLLLILGLFMFGAGMSFFASAGRIVAGILLFLGVVLLIACVFGVLLGLGFFYIKFGLGVQAIAVENKGATEGIARSAELTKKMFWNSFFALLTGGLIYVFIPSISVGITVLVSFADNELYRQIQLAATSFIQLGYALFYPFLATVTTIIFINCKINNEGFDLEVKVDKLLAGEK